MQPVKILLVSGARIVGGAERVTLQLAELLLKRGHRIEALCPHGGGWQAALEKAAIPVHRAPIGGSLNLLTPFAIARTISISRPDLLLVTTSDEWVWSCLIPRHAGGSRLILVRHMGLPVSRRVRWLAGSRADAIVAVAPSVRQALLPDSAIPPGRVHTILNATRFPVRSSIPDAAERLRARQSLGLPASAHWVGFLGGINLGKGIEDAMTAVRRANEKLGDVRLLVCGRKDTRRQTPDGAQLARRCGIEERAQFVGHLDDVIPAIVACDAIVIATRTTLREGLAQTAIDTMACGTPIAAYGLGGVTDAVGATQPAAVLARPDDIEDLGCALTRLLGDCELADNLARRGLERARREFDPALMADRYEQLFAALLQDNAPLDS